MPFSDCFVVRSPTLQSKGVWNLEQDFWWDSPRGRVLIERGFTTDGVSTPRMLWFWIPPFDAKVTRAALPHDYFYTCIQDGCPHPLATTRREADLMLYLACRDAGISLLSCYLIWIGVRLFGRSHVTNRDKKPG